MVVNGLSKFLITSRLINNSLTLTLLLIPTLYPNPPGNYMFKVNNINTRTKGEICSKLTIKTPERRHWRCSGLFIVNLEHSTPFFIVFIIYFEHGNVCWVSFYCFLTSNTLSTVIFFSSFFLFACWENIYCRDVARTPANI